MMRAELTQSQIITLASVADFIDLSATPWRRIQLSARDNVWCLVDAVDFERLSENIWNVWHSGLGRADHWQKYAKRNTGPERSTVRMHREILIEAEPRDDAFLASHFADHINGQTLDNRRENLRWATKQQNGANRRARGLAPSLDALVLQLMAAHGFSKPQEVPF